MADVPNLPTPPLLDLNIRMRYPRSAIDLGPVRLSVGPGEIVGLAGESGSGKSTVGLAIMGLLGMRGGIVSGSIMFEGQDLVQYSQARLRTLRGRRLSLILQNPASALNPGLKLRTQFAEAWLAHSSNRNAWIPAALKTLEAVGLRAEESFFDKYPRELSTGMAQRVLLGISLLHQPALLIADEPTSALDVISQAGVLALFRHLNQDFGLSLLLISHDILGLLSVCGRIAIMRQGTIVETATPHDLLFNPIHPYVQQLVNALPIEVLRSVSSAAIHRRGDS